MLPTAYRFGYSCRVASDSMNQESLLTIKVGGIPAQAVQASMRRIERREWFLWSYVVMVTILLTLAIASFAFPALLYYAPLAVGIRAMPMVVEPAVFVRFLQSQSHADFHLLVQQRRK